MGRMPVESWLGRTGLLRGPRRDGAHDIVAAPRSLGVLSSEASGLLSRVAHLWHSLANDQIARLRDGVFRLDGVQKLVSTDRRFLSALVLSEMLDALGAASRAAALLGRRCSIPTLQKLEQVLPDAVTAAVSGRVLTDLPEYSTHGLRGWTFSDKEMERKVRKMERLAAATVQLVQEMEILAEMEHNLRRAQANTGANAYGRSLSQGVSLMDLGQKVAWQRQEVKALREQSLWDRSYDYIMRLVARALFTIAVRINFIFGGLQEIEPDAGNATAGDCRGLSRSYSETGGRPRCHSLRPDRRSRAVDRRHPHSGPLEGYRTKPDPVAHAAESGPIGDAKAEGRKKPGGKYPPPLSAGKPLTWRRWPASGSPFRGCMISGKDFPVLPGRLKPLAAMADRAGEKAASAVGTRLPRGGLLGGAAPLVNLVDSSGKLVCPPSTTLGASALFLRFANIILVVEKLVEYPHLIGPEARDELYGMLPTSIRAGLRAKLNPCTRNGALCVYDPGLAAEWSDALARILDWLSPLAHNSVRWQSERNFDRQQWPTRSSVLLLQTLHFADQAKTEAAIVEMLVGLNYLWRAAKETSGGTVPDKLCQESCKGAE